MAAKKSYAVIGLGQFGTSVVEELINLGMDVIAIDSDEAAVRKISTILNTAFVADATDEEALKEIGIQDVDTAIIAFGENERAMILTTVILKQMGVKRIIVRVDNDYYAPIMSKLGAYEVVSPQKDAGSSLANRLGAYDYKDFFKLDSKYSVVSIVVNEGFVPVSLATLKPKEKYGVNVVLIVRDGVGSVPGGNSKIIPGDKVFVVGNSKEINSFRVGINGKKGA